MLLHLIATVRSTETWTASHIAAVLVVLVLVIWVVREVRVRRRG